MAISASIKPQQAFKRQSAIKVHSVIKGHSSIKGHSAMNGFTLLELLLVIVIISLLAGVAVLSVGDRRENSLNNEAEKLVATMRWLADQAVFQQQPHGLKILEQGYQLLVWNPTTTAWTASSSYQLPDYIGINPQPPEQLSIEKQPPIVADIVFYPDQDADNDHIDLSIKDSDQTVQLRIGAYREIHIVQN